MALTERDKIKLLRDKVLQKTEVDCSYGIDDFLGWYLICREDMKTVDFVVYYLEGLGYSCCKEKGYRVGETIIFLHRE